MTTGLEHLQHSLLCLGDARAVSDIARRYLDAWPDMHTLARKAAAGCLRKHTGQRLNPDKVWWHRFEGASTSSHSFTGWQHAGPPAASMRFTELLLRRFDEGFQAAPDTLDLYSGFYYQGPGARLYNEHNEVALLPSTVMADLWALNFATLVRARTQRFWAERRGDFLLLAKVQMLAAITQALRQGHLQAIDREHLYRYIGLDPHQPLTLATLKTATPSEPLAIKHYVLGNHGHMFTLQAPGGRVVLYTPTASPVLRAFASPAHLVRGVAVHLASPQGQAWVDALYRFDDASTAQMRSHTLEELRAHIGTPHAPTWPFGIATALTQDVFAELAVVSQQDMQTSQTALVSNADLRKALWRGYLGAFMQVVGGLAPAAWPFSLALVGAGVARLALDLDARGRARSAGARSDALLAAVTDAIAIAFGMADIAFGVQALRLRAPPHERLTSIAHWQPVEWPAEGAVEVEATGHPALPSPQRGPGLLGGISVSAKGQTWIELAGRPYRVRYSAELHTWLVVRADAPFAFAPLRPVRLNEAGQWQWLGVPRLAGGVPGGLEQATSPFWDFYMQPDPELSEQISCWVAERQRAVLDAASIAEIAPEADPLFDEHDYEYVLAGGARHYTYRQGGQYYNNLLHIYSDEMTQANHLFRFGITSAFEVGDGDMHAYIERLCDSLAQLPRSNTASLWRGGHASRNTSGLHLRNGARVAGDIMVSTDLTSFTENPYALRDFVAPRQVVGIERVENVFDETSVIYELPYQGYQSGVPIAPLSQQEGEAETLFLPGHCFRIESVQEIHQPAYRFIWVKLREVSHPGTGPIYDLRTGALFDRAIYAARINNEALVERLFPQSLWSGQSL
ncbi:dermonecrotic toxin domain-containing protein [Pseudomonas typographi]|uniref:dermonecrotic toxin domain-containing protein n=1 Tax=Pseudomonas typographi TaxID=2715964 RepID=UPI001683F4E8|nr:DUF6543 domain-containing protein [Pseudomonas typographi]MBD1549886.1 hypothetical protein [Pseudomonas typographi]